MTPALAAYYAEFFTHHFGLLAEGIEIYTPERFWTIREVLNVEHEGAAPVAVRFKNGFGASVVVPFHAIEAIVKPVRET